MITVSHDRYLIGKLATRILDLTPDCVTDMRVHTPGRGYEELCRERARRREIGGEAAAATAAPSTQKEQYLRNKQEQAEARKAKARLERLRAEMEKLEAELERIEAEMTSDAIATDYIRLSELDTRKTQVEDRLLELYEELE